MNKRRKLLESLTLGPIESPPQLDLAKATLGELFLSLKITGGWTFDAIVEVIQAKTNKENMAVDTIKKWAYENKKPTGENKTALFDIIRECSVEGNIAQQWINAFNNCWVNATLNKSPNYINALRQNILKSPYITRLPPLFETDLPLPVATTYVDLSLSPSLIYEASPLLLESNLTLAQKIHKRIESRFAIRKSPKDLLDKKKNQSTLILGPPGSGKSSLLRKIAIEVSEKKWSSLHIPLFLEVRAYWSLRKSTETDLISFALSNFLTLKEDISAAKKELITNKQGVILLVDGLDEIAGDPTAVNIIYSELKQISSTIPWIVTARPAGLMSNIGETQRCEMVELDDDSIEALIDNWNVSSQSVSTLGDQDLKTEVFGSPSILSLARNPFLLTAVCFIKNTSPSEKLPTTRVQIYELLLEKICLQAQLRNSQALTSKVMNDLQDFALHLYEDNKDGPIQIFNIEQWWSFATKKKLKGKVDFKQQILPSRLLSVWGETNPRYHFLHLSLHEFLAAKALLKYPVEDVVARRFAPAWRSIFKFYGALLKLNNKTEEFRELVQLLYEEEDFNNLSLLTLAEIFSCAGVSDTEKWIGVDLRDKLHIAAQAGHQTGPTAMNQAMAELAPHWFEEKAKSEISNFLRLTEQEEETQNTYRYSKYVVAGDRYDCPYEKLAQARTGSAKEVISKAFWGENQKLALISAYAFASIATPSDRKRVLVAGKNAKMFDDMSTRIYAFAQASRRSDFLNFLERVTRYFSDSGAAPFSEALNEIADIGSSEAIAILERLAKNEVPRLKEIESPFETILYAISRSGGDEAVAALNRINQIPETKKWREILELHCITANPADDTSILKMLPNASLEGITSALSGAATFGRIPSDGLLSKLKESITLEIDEDEDVDIINLSFVEAERIDIGRPPLLCDVLLKAANSLYLKLLKTRNENEREEMITDIVVIFDTLGRAYFEPARELATKILFNDKAPNLLQAANISLIGYLFSETKDIEILNKLISILYSENSDCTEAAIAIGRIDLEELFRLQDAEGAYEALEELAAKNDILIYDKFWADRFGNCTNWTNPPNKILYIHNDDSFSLVQVFTHETSRYGLSFDSGNIEETVACFIFGTPQDAYEKRLMKKATEMNITNPNYKLFYISDNLSEEKARTKANKIGSELAS